MSKLVIGILALQGAFNAHINKINSLGIKNIDIILVKNKVDLRNINSIILPGGESTSIFSLLKKHNLLYELTSKLSLPNFPILATCAGLILLSKFKILRIAIKRNGYGGQMQSMVKKIYLNISTYDGHFMQGYFIRAPIIKKIFDENIKVLAHSNGFPVLLKKNNIIASTFHPELACSDAIHRMFINLLPKD